MPPMRHFVSIQDLSNDEIEILFVLADKMARFLHQSHGVLAGYILGSLFYEPSTRTRLSFESAMNRLGGRVITMSDPRSSSAAKGETLADSVRIVGSYTDIIVLRHPHPGAARVAAEYSPVPVVNAGDGGHEHPTQTLCDLYTLRQSKGRITGLRVILYGDLKYGRTTHSLAVALARMGADVLCVAEQGLELPDFVLEQVLDETGRKATQVELVNDKVFRGAARRGTLFAGDPSAWGDRDGVLDLATLACDALYVTRLQRERLEGAERERASSLPPVDRAFLEFPGFSDTVVLHPLPRVDEIDYDVDKDPRGLYFRQAALGVPIRMALISLLLGRETMRADGPVQVAPEAAVPGERCSEPRCIVNVESRCLELKVRSTRAGERRCHYCDAALVRG